MVPLVILFIVAVLLIGPSFILLFILQHRRLLEAGEPATPAAGIAAGRAGPPAPPPTAPHPGTRAVVLALIILNAIIRRRRQR